MTEKPKRKNGYGLCPKCGSRDVRLIPPVIADATFGRMCMDCRHTWESNEGVPMIRQDDTTEKPKRKIIPCPNCNCDEGLKWQIGLPQGWFQCPICWGIWNQETGETEVEPPLEGNSNALKYQIGKSFGLFNMLDVLTKVLKAMGISDE